MFHTAAPGFVEVTSQHPDPAVARRFEDMAAQDLQLYRDAGVNSALLYWPMYLQEGLCYHPLMNARGGVHDILYKSNYALVVFSERALRQMGLTFEGRHPNTEQEARELYASYRVRLTLGRTQIRFVEELPDMTIEEVKGALRRTRQCTAEDMAGFPPFPTPP